MLAYTINKDNEEKILRTCCLQTTKNSFLYFGHVKLYINVLNIFTKEGTHRNMLCYRRECVISSKTAKVKIGIKTLRPSKDFLKSRSIPNIPLSLNI